MELVKNKVEDPVPYDQPLLLLLDIENEPNYVWTIGEYTPEGWITYDDWATYQVVEWYELPFRCREQTELEDWSSRQLSFEDFWYDR